jgi:hypothetical protein
MSTTASKRSAAQWIVTVVFGALSLAFLLRAVIYGAKWLRHVVEGDANFKALTVWCLLYMIVCAAIAFVAFRFPSEKNAEVAGSDTPKS